MPSSGRLPLLDESHTVGSHGSAYGGAILRDPEEGDRHLAEWHDRRPARALI
jgi:hypothetical protein